MNNQSFRGADVPPDDRVHDGNAMPSDTERAVTQGDLHGRDDSADRDIRALQYAYAERWQSRAADGELTHWSQAEDVEDDDGDLRHRVSCLICGCYEQYRFTAEDSCCNLL